MVHPTNRSNVWGELESTKDRAVTLLMDSWNSFSRSREYNTVRSILRGASRISSWIAIQLIALIGAVWPCFLIVVIVMEHGGDISTTFIGVPLLIFLILTLAVEVWRFGQGLRSILREYWEAQTPPHGDEIDTRDGIGDWVAQDIISLDSTVKNPFQLKNQGRAIKIGSLHLGFGYLLFILIGLIFTTVYDAGLSNNLESTKLTISAVTLPATMFSVILGGVFGLATLLLAAVAKNIWQALVLAAFFGIPAVFIVPGIRNLLHHLESSITDFIDRNYPKNRYRGVVLLAVITLAIIVISGTAAGHILMFLSSL